MKRYPYLLRLLVVALVTVASVAVLATPPAAAYPAPAGRLAPVIIPGVYRPVQQTLSWPEAQPTQTPRGVTVDWLGVRFAGTRDLPPLVLTGVYAPGPGDWYVYLDYTRADDASGGPAVTLLDPRRNRYLAAAILKGDEGKGMSTHGSRRLARTCRRRARHAATAWRAVALSADAPG